MIETESTNNDGAKRQRCTFGSGCIFLVACFQILFGSLLCHEMLTKPNAPNSVLNLFKPSNPDDIRGLPQGDSSNIEEGVEGQQVTKNQSELSKHSHLRGSFDVAFDRLLQTVLQLPNFSDTSSSSLSGENSRENGSCRRFPFNATLWTRQTAGGLQDDDRVLLAKTYASANSIFEFGLGESTYIAAETNVPRYSGVDSDPVWVAQAREGASAPPTLNVEDWTEAEKKRKGSHFRFYFADIGPTGAWGYPKDKSRGDGVYKKVRNNINALNYQMSALRSEPAPFDVYLVDGRYRVACVMSSFLHAMQTGGNMTNVRVLLHDLNFPGRGYATGVDGLVNVLEKSEKLWVMQLKEDTTEEQLLTRWEQHSLVVTR